MKSVFVTLAKLVKRIFTFIDSQLFLIFSLVFLYVSFRNMRISYMCFSHRLYDLSIQIAVSSIASALYGIVMIGIYVFEHIFDGRKRINNFIKGIFGKAYRWRKITR